MKFKPPCTALKLGPNSLFFPRDPPPLPPSNVTTLQFTFKAKSKKTCYFKVKFSAPNIKNS